METLIGYKNEWKGINTLEEAVQLIDYGVVLKWRDMRTLKKSFSVEDQVELIKHFVVRLCERADNRLSAEITVESLLIWMANGESEDLVTAFIDEFFQQPQCEEACRVLVEISLTSEVVENTHDEDIFSMAVALICELGAALREHERQFPGDIDDVKGILDHITTYLLSVSNSNNTCIRLSLLHYFGTNSMDPENVESFNRIMSRFGHTVLDHLFTLLFRKRTEAVALQYLSENLPCVLMANHHGQCIIHETLKYYMLKHPERFGLFVQIFSDHLMTLDPFFEEAKKNFARHLGALLKIASSVNHKPLARDISLALVKYEEGWRNMILDELASDGDLRKPIRNLVLHLREGKNPDKIPDSISQFRSNKRGRKPTFSRSDLAPMNQISYLGAVDVPRAS